MRRLLIITYHFPPDGAIGGQRWSGLSNYLSRLGWEIHVLTASGLPAGHDPTPWVRRHVCPRRRTLDDWYRSRVRRVSESVPIRPTPADSKSNRAPGLPARRIGALRRILRSSMYLPDAGRGWILRAARRARALVREKPFDLIITSGPPHSTHFVGVASTLGLKTPLWIDMRDPWAAIHELNAPQDWLVKCERAFLSQLERLVLPRASRIIVNTPAFAKTLGSETRARVIHLPNGVDPAELGTRDVRKVVPHSVTHVGTIYAGRNLSPVLAAMSEIVRSRPQAGESLRLNVAGSMGSEHRAQMVNQITEGKLESLVTIHGVLRREQALELLTQSHLALVLAQNQPLCVPAKLYESVGLGVPTLVIAEPDSAAATEARRIGAMTADATDVAAVRSILENLLDGVVPMVFPTIESISYEKISLEADRYMREAIDASVNAPVQPVLKTLSSAGLAAGRGS